jgi:hypothetical protein
VGGHSACRRGQLRARPVEILLGNEQIEQVEHKQLAVLRRQVIGLPKLLIDRGHHAPIGKLG